MPMRRESGRAYVAPSKKRPKPAPRHAPLSAPRAAAKREAYSIGRTATVVAAHQRNVARARDVRTSREKDRQRRRSTSMLTVLPKRRGQRPTQFRPTEVDVPKQRTMLDVLPKGTGQRKARGYTPAADAIRKDIKKVYTPGESLRLKTKTDALLRLREQGIFVDPSPKKKYRPTYIKTRGSKYEFEKVQEGGKIKKVYGQLLSDGTFREHKAPPDVIGNIVGSIGNRLKDQGGALVRTAANAGKVVGGIYQGAQSLGDLTTGQRGIPRGARAQTAGLNTPGAVSPSVAQTFKKGALATGSVLLDYSNRPLAAGEAAAARGLVAAGIGGKKLRGRVARSPNVAQSFLHKIKATSIVGADLAEAVGLPRQVGLGVDLALDPTMYVGAAAAPFTGGASLALIGERILRIAPQLAKSEKVIHALELAKSADKADQRTALKELREVVKSKEFRNARRDSNRASWAAANERRMGDARVVIDKKGRASQIDLPGRAGLDAVEAAIRGAEARRTKVQPRLALMTPTGRRIAVRGRELAVPLTPDLGKLPIPRRGKDLKQLIATRQITERAQFDDVERVELARIETEREAALRQRNDAEVARLDQEARDVQDSFTRQRKEVGDQVEQHLRWRGRMQTVDEAIQGRKMKRQVHVGIARANALGRTVDRRAASAIEQAIKGIGMKAGKRVSASDRTRSLERVQMWLNTHHDSGGAADAALGQAIQLTDDEMRAAKNLMEAQRAIADNTRAVVPGWQGRANYTGQRIWNQNDTLQQIAERGAGMNKLPGAHHRTIAAVSEYASKEQMARALQRLSDGPLSDDDAFRLADEIWANSQHRLIADTTMQRLQRGEEINWEELGPVQKEVIDRAARMGVDPGKGGTPLFRTPNTDPSTEGRVLLNPRALDELQLSQPDVIANQAIPELALSAKLSAQRIVDARRGMDDADPYAQELDGLIDKLNAKGEQAHPAWQPVTRESGGPGAAEIPAESPTPREVPPTAERLPDEEPGTIETPTPPAYRVTGSGKSWYVVDHEDNVVANADSKAMANSKMKTAIGKAQRGAPAKPKPAGITLPKIPVARRKVLQDVRKTPPNPKINRKYEMPEDAVLRAAAHLDLKYPLEVHVASGQPRGLYLGVQDGKHQIIVPDWVSREKANEIFWEEAAHARQYERDPFRWESDLKEYQKIVAKGDHEAYKNHPWEQEAHRVGEPFKVADEPMPTEVAPVPEAAAPPPEPHPEVVETMGGVPQPNAMAQQPLIENLPDFRRTDDTMVELDPRVAGYHRARAEGLRTAGAARFQGFDRVYGRNKTDDTLFHNKKGDIFVDKKTGEQYYDPHTMFGDRAGIDTIPEHRVWPASVATAVMHDLKMMGDYDQVFYQGVESLTGRTMAQLRFGVTTPFPAYHIRNIVSDTLKSLQADSGVMFHPIVNARLALGAFNRGLGRNIRVPGYGKMKMEDFMHMADALGVKETHHLDEVAQIVRDGKITDSFLSRHPHMANSWWVPGGKSTRFGMHRENVVRLQTFVQRMRANGGDSADAAWYTIKHHFDYADLSANEKRFVRNLFLFYTWYRKNIPLQLVELMRRPGFFTGMASTYRNLEAGTTPLNVGPFEGEAPNQPALPDYVRDTLQSATVNWNGHALNVGFGAPWADLGWVSEEGLLTWATMANPVLGQAIQQSTRQDPLTGRTYKEDEPSQIAEILKSLGVDGIMKDEKGRAVLPWRLAILLRQAPIIGRGSSSIGAVSATRDQGRLSTYGKYLAPITGLNLLVSPGPGSAREKQAIQGYLLGRAAERRDLMMATSQSTPARREQKLKAFDAETMRDAKQRGITKYLKTAKGSGFYVRKDRRRRTSGTTLGGASSSGGGFNLGG